MPVEVLMPALSPTMKEGKIVKWVKKEGDKIKSGDIIAEIETDKATMELEASNTGTLGKIIIQEGDETVAVNTLIALMLKDGEDKKSLEGYKHVSAPVKGVAEQVAQSVASIATKESSVNSKPSEKAFASPLAKRMAENAGINISSIEGSGPHGRVIKADVIDLSEKKGSGSVAMPVQTSRSSEEYKVISHTSTRKVIAKRLLESKQTVPHFYLSLDVKMNELLEFRQKVNKALEANGVKVSVNDLIIKASSLALRDFPLVNASWGENGMMVYTNVDISVAVSTENGLITPIIKNADLKSVTSISSEMKTLAKKARENKLRLDEFQGGGFSISNLGMYGIKSFSAIINPPQSCILAVGETTKQPIYCVKSDCFKPADIMNLTLSADHRVVDGALGADFLNKIRFYLENPVLMAI